MLLRQTVDLNGPLGIAYERSAGFFKSAHRHDRHMLVCPRGACRMEVHTPPSGVYAVDAASVLLVPQQLLHDDEATSAIYDTLALYPSDAFFTECFTDAGVSPGDQATFVSGVQRFHRSAWLETLLERYFNHRVLGVPAARGGTTLLETQLLHEVARLLQGDNASPKAPQESAPQVHDLVAQALVFIESHLFEPIDVKTWCRALATSESTLLRAFKHALGQSPTAYIRGRRLDEGAQLLATGNHAVTEVALLVGYNDVAAFTRAFRRRFQVPPSAWPDRSLR